MEKLTLSHFTYEPYEDGINLLDIRKEFKSELEELVIPNEWNVVAIAKLGYFAKEPFKKIPNLKKVVLPNTLRYLEEAFCNCANLEEVVFNDNLEKLHNWNFRDCHKLKTVKLPSGLTKVGYGNFEDSPYYDSCYEKEYGCVYMDNYLIKCVDNGYDTAVIKDGTTVIADCAYAEKKFNNVVFPNSLKHIGLQAFYYCNRIKNVELPEDIISVGNEAFKTENGDLLKSSFVCNGYFDKNGKLIIEKEFSYISPKKLKQAVDYLDNYLLKVTYEEISTYDNSDDDRASDSYSRDTLTVYRSFDANANTKSLLRIDGEIKGVVFFLRPYNRDDPSRHAFLFDGSYNQGLTTGYSASHSSNQLTIKKVTLVKKGENGAPETAPEISFNLSVYDRTI